MINIRMNRQAGFTLIELSIALVIAALIASVTLREHLKAASLENAGVQGDVTATVMNATNKYIFENYGALQSLLPVTVNGANIPAGAGPGETLAPRIEDLVATGYLPTGFMAVSQYNGGTYRVALNREPAGCAPANCNINGYIYLDQPILAIGTNEVNVPNVGAMLTRIGGNGMASWPDDVANLRAIDGSTVANPVAGKAGIVGARVGSNSTGFGVFVRIADTRDPNLQGPLTVAGPGSFHSSLSVSGTTTSVGDITGNGNVGAKDPGSGCLRAALQATGEILSRAADCVTRFVAKSDGTAAANDSTGQARAVLVGDTGRLEARSAGGVAVASLDGSTGRVTGGSLTATSTANANASCAGFAEGDMVRDAAVDGTLLACRSGTWRRPGLPQGTEGAPCASAGALAMDAVGKALVCRNGLWRSLNDRVSSVVAMATFGGNGPGGVPAPMCGAGGSPDLMVSPLESGADYGSAPPRNRFSLQSSWTGGGWNITPVLTDQAGVSSTTGFDGVPYSFGWVATTLCNYGSGN